MNERRFVLDTEQHRDFASRFVGNLDISRPVELIVRDHVPHRTTTQNARLWALHQMAARLTGYSPDELHELMLCKFFGTKEIEVGGVRRTVPLKRSSTRDKAEFREFMDNVENFYAAELGIWLDQEAA